MLTKIGSYGTLEILLDHTDGEIAVGICGLPRDFDHAVGIIVPDDGETVDGFIDALRTATVDGFIDALRTATTDPRDRVIAAARRLVAGEGLEGGEDYDALVSAVEALESAECDDA